MNYLNIVCNKHHVGVVCVYPTFNAPNVRNAYTGFWWGNLRERDQWGDPGVDGRIILRWSFRKWNVGIWTGSNWLMIGTGGGYL
jgi:hypothetical protein